MEKSDAATVHGNNDYLKSEGVLGHCACLLLSTVLLHLAIGIFRLKNNILRPNFLRVSHR